MSMPRLIDPVEVARLVQVHKGNWAAIREAYKRRPSGELWSRSALYNAVYEANLPTRYNGKRYHAPKPPKPKPKRVYNYTKPETQVSMTWWTPPPPLPLKRVPCYIADCTLSPASMDILMELLS